MEKVFDLTLELKKNDRVPNFSRIFDPEKLLRLNPNWFINEFKTEDGLATAGIKDYVTGEHSDVVFRVDSSPAGGMILDFDEGAVARMEFTVENRILRVRATPRYLGPTSEEETNIQLWLRSIGVYLRLYMTASISRLISRVFLNQFMLKMNPSQRKISIMIMKITVVEIMVVLMIVVGYVIFAQ